MEIIQVSVLGVVLATVASYFVGFLWHGPVFGKQWMAMMGYTPDSVSSMRLTGLQAMIGGFIAQFVQVYILAIFLLGITNILSALTVTLLLWLGFVTTTQLGGVLWENRAPKLFFFNAAYQIVQLGVAAIVLVLV